MSREYKLVRHHEDLGTFLKKARVQAGLTQKNLADYLGYSSAQFISNFERGISMPPLSKLGRMAKKLKMGSKAKELPEFYAAAAERKATEALRC